MADHELTYVIHIATTSEQLWEALTSPEVLGRNWGKIESQWAKGSRVTEVDDSGKVLWKGEVCRSEPPRLLSYTMDVTGIGDPRHRLGQGQYVPSPWRSGDQANHSRSIETRDSIC